MLPEFLMQINHHIKHQNAPGFGHQTSKCILGQHQPSASNIKWFFEPQHQISNGFLSVFLMQLQSDHLQKSLQIIT